MLALAPAHPLCPGPAPLPRPQEESAKVAAVRHAYQRALLVPTAQLEGLWRGYENFEMGGSNKQLARRLLDEWRPRYQAGGRGAPPPCFADVAVSVAWSCSFVVCCCETALDWHVL